MTDRAGIWLRVSSSGQDEENQEPDIRDYCADESRRYEVVKSYPVHGKSAFHDQQLAKLEEAVADVESGLINVLVFWVTDRMWRSDRAPEAIALVQRIAKAGGRIEFAIDDDNLNRGPKDDPWLWYEMFSRAMGRAWKESKRKSDRTRIKQSGLLDKGALVGRPPFGYRRVGIKCGDSPCECRKGTDAKTLVPDIPGTGDTLLEMVRRYLDGQTLGQIARYLDDTGIRTSSKTTRRGWDPRIVRHILTSETLIGKRRFGPDNRLITFTPILDVATWRKLQAALKANSVRRGPARETPAFLIDILRCQTCNGPMHWRQHGANKHNGNRAGYTWAGYRCDGTSKNPSTCKNMISADKIHGVVSEVMAEYADMPYFVTDVIQGHDYGADLDDNRAAIAVLDIDSPTYDADLAALRSERKRIEHDRDNSEPDEVKIHAQGTIGQQWANRDQAARRELLLDLGWKLYAIGKRGESPVVVVDIGPDYLSMVARLSGRDDLAGDQAALVQWAGIKS